jgi:hypothetical protein
MIERDRVPQAAHSVPRAGVLLAWAVMAGTCFGQANQADKEVWLSPEALAMPRQRISMSLPGSAIRLYSVRGCVAIRDMTVTGIQRLSFPPQTDGGYRFNLAFRDEATGTLVQDLQDEGGDPLYYNLVPGVSNKLGANRGGKDGWTWVLLSQDSLWQPNCVTRTGTFHKFVKGQVVSFGVESRTSLSFEADEIYEEVKIENRMDRPLVLTLIPDQHANPRSPSFVLQSAGFQIAAVSDLGPAGTEGWRIEVPAKGQRTARIALLLQKAGQAVPAGHHAADLAARVEKGQAAARQMLRWASERLPRIDTQNKSLDEFYRRSILSVLNCRWDRENFCSRPFYDFGQRAGLSVTWDISFSSEMLSVLDPEGLKEALYAHFRGGISNCTWLRWSGQGFGNYAQHPMAVVRILNDYIRQTGDATVLDHVESGASVFQWLKRLANDMQNKYARPDGLLDYGGDTMALLEIRTSGYEHVVAATNAMAADYFRQLARWCRLRNDPDAARFEAWAERLQKAVNETLWNDREGWFDNLYPDGSRHLVLSYHQFDVLDGQVVSLDRKRRMIARIKEGEFLGPYGMFSIARSDRAHWDREDCDFGGGGQYIGQPLRIAESLYRMGENQNAWDVLSRCTRWIERFPYFPQSIYADDLILQPHQMDWPLEISAGGGAQAVIFGLFGLRPHVDGSLEVCPAYNGTLGEARLKGYRFRGHKYDVIMTPAKFQVWRDGQTVAEQPYGQAVRLPPAPSTKPVTP